MIECHMTSYGGVYAGRKTRDVRLFATVCHDCGNVVRTYCKEPEKLFPKKERRE